MSVVLMLLAVAFLIFRFSKMSGGGSTAGMSAVQKIQEGAFILDVRSEGEFHSGHYPGAKNIPVNAVSSRLNEIPKDRPVVVYCAAGGRSAQAADILRSSGYADVTNAGGLSSLMRASQSNQQ